MSEDTAVEIVFEQEAEPAKAVQTESEQPKTEASATSVGYACWRFAWHGGGSAGIAKTWPQALERLAKTKGQ